MFIRRREYDALKDEIANLREAKARAESSAGWLRVRVNQLELEAAALKAELTGKPQTVPQVDRVDNPLAIDHPNAPLDFEDMGDDKAAALGVDWDHDGRVKYRN